MVHGGPVAQRWNDGDACIDNAAVGETESSYRQLWRTLRSGRIARVAVAYAAAGSAIERRLAIDPDDSAAYDHGSGVLALLGRKEESRRFNERAVALRPDDPQTHYNAACNAMLSGDHETALDLLERAIALGFSNTRWIMNDNDLVPLHDHPRFKRLVAQLA
jgi:Flp pilus assembly protein TadD